VILREPSMSAARSAVSAFLVLFLAAWPWTAAPAAADAPATAIKRDFESCRVHANIDACYDALRWKPSDPALLVALGDAQLRAQRAADAIRAYKRAAEIAPNTPGLAAKISAIEAKLSSKHAAGNGAAHGVPAHADAGKHFSNAAPESQSH
jgi:cytochrome c-type biogenesis protein CcmH/NrfG